MHCAAPWVSPENHRQYPTGKTYPCYVSNTDFYILQKCIEDRITNRIPTEVDDYTDEFLVECFTMNLKLTVLLHDEVRPNFNRQGSHASGKTGKSLEFY